ncbi:MAG: nucleotidyltransferase domain-containing protein [Candidatus Woesearchaeota archaeon]
MVRITDNMLEIISLYRSDYKAQFHIREMARQIKVSHVSLLPHLKLLENDNILVSKQIGKSKTYILNLNNNKGREYLSLSEKKKGLLILDSQFFLKKIRDEFISINLGGCLVLFGSFAKSTESETSDIDLLYIGLINKKTSTLENFGRIYGKEIHLMHMTLGEFREHLAKANAMAWEAVKNHVILLNHDIWINELWRYYNERR